MPVDNKFERVDADSPLRCQATCKDRQCPYKRCEHSEYCPMHNGGMGEVKHKADSARMYRLAVWQQRVAEFADSDQVKGLRDEIGILRLLLEQVLNTCKDATDLLMYASRISELVTKIQSVVVSCNRLEQANGGLMDKSQALHLAANIVEIVGRYVKDDTAIDSISNEITLAIVDPKKIEEG